MFCSVFCVLLNIIKFYIYSIYIGDFIRGVPAFLARFYLLLAAGSGFSRGNTGMIRCVTIQISRIRLESGCLLPVRHISKLL